MVACPYVHLFIGYHTVILSKAQRNASEFEETYVIKDNRSLILPNHPTAWHLRITPKTFLSVTIDEGMHPRLS